MRRQTQPLYMKHYAYLNNEPDIYDIFYPGTSHSTSESKHNDIILICGKKGSGKTELAKFMAYVYHQNNPDNRVIVLCGIDTLYDDLTYAKIIDLNEVAEDEKGRPKDDYTNIPPLSDFSNSLVIFDDTERYHDPKVEKMLHRLCNLIAQNGRNYNVSMICILHQLNKGLQSTTILREADSVVIFPRAYDQNTFNTLVNHFGMYKWNVKQLYDNKDEWFIFIHYTIPSYIFFGTSMEKVDI